MTLDARDIAREAAATGFPAETLEKVFRLIGLLNALHAHPYLRKRIALKGGTALNLFWFDVPRLSVDIDLNYVGAANRETMMAERPKVEQAVEAVCGREGLVVRRVPSEHAGGKWRLTYTASTGRSGNLEVDLNYMLRVPLWPPDRLDSKPVGTYQATQVLVLDRHELAAGKLAALCARTAGRDIFDARELLLRGDLDRERLRLAFVVYGGANRKDWRTVTSDTIWADVGELRSQLLPTLRGDHVPAASDLPGWTERLSTECRDLMSAVLPLTVRETEFITRLNDHGEIVPDLLIEDPMMQSLIFQNPSLQWKALNVRQHRGLADKEPTT